MDRKHILVWLDELLMSEKVYIKRMELIINGYIAEYQDENSSIPVPESLEGVGCLLFYNINDIYEWHKNYFSKALMEHQNSLTEIGQVFTQNEHQFHMHAKYCKNIKISNYIIGKNRNYFEEVKKKLGHKLVINDLLFAPVQRITHYKLLLAGIVQYNRHNNLIEHLDSLNSALSMIKTVCNNINDFVALQFIPNLDLRIPEPGNLLLHGRLSCKYDGKYHKQYVFLFKKLILFTTKQEAKSKYLDPTYTRCLQIPVNKLQLNGLKKNKFLVKSTGPYSSEEIVCEADTNEMYQQWFNAIMKEILQQQKFIRSLIYDD